MLMKNSKILVLVKAKPAKNILLAKAKPSKSEWNRLLSRVVNPRKQTYLEYTRTSGVL